MTLWYARGTRPYYVLPELVSVGWKNSEWCKFIFVGESCFPYFKYSRGCLNIFLSSGKSTVAWSVIAIFRTERRKTFCPEWNYINWENFVLFREGRGNNKTKQNKKKKNPRCIIDPQNQKSQTLKWFIRECKPKSHPRGYKKVNWSLNILT